jgi:hypothetical protein
MRSVSLAAIFAALFVVGCVQPPSTQELASADYGEYPQDYEEIIKRYNLTMLKDPGSAIYEAWRGPSSGWASGIGTGTKYGWRVCVLVNAKNGFGGYTGFEPAGYIIHDGVVTLYHPRICESM